MEHVSQLFPLTHSAVIKLIFYVMKPNSSKMMVNW